MTVTEIEEKRAVRRIAVAFAISALAGLSLAAVYVSGGQVQAEGLLLFLALAGLGWGLAEWAAKLLPSGPEVGDYADPPRPGAEREVAEVVEEGWEESFGRRKFLFRMLGAAAGAMGLALVFPIRSLGPSPGTSLLRTAWRRGSRMVREDGQPVRAADLAVEGILTVFPEGQTDQADSQTVLIRLDPSVVRPVPGREDWTADGLIAYSKICTHAGCPVGLYRVATHDLFCPCHQSTFDVLNGAKPIAGPATRALPQLPIEVDDEGFVVAKGDFSEPVGPAFWNMPQ
ncbi:MAG TPA: Rieske 2Fe-2S domain-containing protein [Actinomycetota bacterium]|nr:Rieske 2Fe-2S domain-containing protein [Actinomycetota bacterium]